MQPHFASEVSGKLCHFLNASESWSVAVPVATGASREAPVDNACFSTILTTRNPRISGLVPTLAKPSACSVAGLLRNGKQVTQ